MSVEVQGEDLAEAVGRQGRTVLRMAAAVEGLTGQAQSLERWVRDTLTLTRARERELEDALAYSKQETSQVALEAIRIVDALEWARDAAKARKDEEALALFDTARQDCIRRLAAVGVTEIPTEGEFDGRLHESLGVRKTKKVPQYHIVSVARRGWLRGSDVLRRAQVETAA
ncbi:MAG: nucleotide exchange factor GrpE [Armatimonas sp.]